jgi:hypothetical protein
MGFHRVTILSSECLQILLSTRNPLHLGNHLPTTFYEVKKLSPTTKEGPRFFIDSYQQSIQEDGSFGMVWCALFENGKLIGSNFSNDKTKITG